MSSGTGLEDFSLIELFRGEVETHSETLSNALLERNPSDTSRVDEMMRAAHSIKGAARIVGVDPAVNVAHVMEDCFVAAQKGTITLTPGDVDVLLRGVDLLGRISEATRDPAADLVELFAVQVDEAVSDLQAVLSGTRKPAAEPTRPVTSSGLAATPDPVSAGRTPSQAVALPAQADARVGDVVISVPSILDSLAAEVVRLQILSAVDQQAVSIRLDLKETRDLDVQGLALLAAVPSHLALRSRATLGIEGLSSEMETVFRVTGLAEPYGLRSRWLAKG